MGGKTGSHFRKCVVAAIFPIDRNVKPDDMKRWITLGGGQWRHEVSEDVTHLICSKEAYIRNGQEIQLAKENHVEIVHYDWLEDSSQKAKCLPLAKYRLSKILKTGEKIKSKRKKQESTILRRQAKKHKDGEKAAIEDIGSSKQACTLTNADLKAINPDIEHTHVANGTSLVTDSNQEIDEDVESLPELEELLSTTNTPSHIPDQVNISNAQPQPPSSFKKLPDEDKSTDTATKEWQQSKPSSRRKRNHLPRGVHGTVIRLRPPVPNLPGPIERANDRAKRQLEDDSKLMPFPDRHHVYQDIETGKTLNLTLVHIEIAKNRQQRAFLRLYESDSVPHTYAVALRSGSNDELRHKLNQSTLPEWADPRSAEIRAPVGSNWETAWTEFRKAFLEITGWKWEQNHNSWKFIGSDDPRMQPIEYIEQSQSGGDAIIKSIKPVFFIWPDAKYLKPKPERPSLPLSLAGYDKSYGNNISQYV